MLRGFRVLGVSGLGLRETLGFEVLRLLGGF